MQQITKETFDREIAMCENLSRKNSGHYAWGECATCGVIPLLYKLRHDKLLEEKSEIEKVKDEIIFKPDRGFNVKEAIGWLGALAIVVAYFLNSFNLIANESLIYLLLNALGAAGIIFISLKKKSFQPAVVNIFWLLIAFVGLIRLFF